MSLRTGFRANGLGAGLSILRWSRILRLACFLGLLTAFIAALWALTVLAQTPPLKVTLSVPANTQLTEGGGNSVVTVTASIASGRSADLIIDLSLGGTAKSSDYEVVGSLPAITITAGQTTGTGDVTLSAMDDSFFEGPETLRVEGTIRGQPQDEVASVDITIADNDSAPQLNVTVDPPNRLIQEGARQQFDIVVSLIGGGRFEESETITVSLADDNQIEPPDERDFAKDGRYLPSEPPWNLTLPAGSGSATIRVTFDSRDDMNDSEGREEARLVAELTAVGATLSKRFRLFTLTDPIRYATFSVSCDELPAYTGTTDATCHARISNPQAIRSYVVTMTAEKPQLVEPDSVTFPSISYRAGGNRSADMDVQFTVEQRAAGETLRWNLSVAPDEGISNAVLRPFAVATWPAADSDFQISEYDARVVSTTSGIATRGFTVFEIVFSTPRPVTIVGPPSVEIVLDSGVVSAPCTVQGARIRCRYLVQEGDYDFDRTVELRTGAVKFTGWRDRRDTTVSGGVASPLPAQGKSYSGFPLVFGGTHAIDIGVSPQSLQEGAGEQQLTITAQDLTGKAAATDVVIPLSIADITTSPSDYSVTGTLSVTIPKGSSEGRTTGVSMTAIADPIRENRIEKLRIEGTKGAMMTPFVRGAELSIIDSASIALSVSPAEVAENGSAREVMVTAEWGDPADSVLPRDTEVTLSWGGTAGPGDYSRTGGATVTIPANGRSGTTSVTITPTDDKLLEGNETVHISGTALGHSVFPANLTITDDETVPAVTLAVDVNSLSEGGRAEMVTVSATLDAEVAMANDETTVTLDLAGTAALGEDYTASWSPSSQVITIPRGATAGSNTVTLTLTPTDDSVKEDDEIIVVQGTATTDMANRDLVVKVATITLLDDDALGVFFSPTALTVDEGSTATYEVWLGTRPSDTVTVSLSSTDMSVATVNSNSLTFGPTTWSTRQPVTVNGVDDDLRNGEDGKRTAEIHHTAAGGDYDDAEVATLPVTVSDDEEPVRFTIADGSADEGQAITFNVTRLGAAGAAATVDWSTADDTDGSYPASAGDYTAQTTAQTLSFAAGETRKTITVQTTQDTLDEEDETFLVKLSAPSTGTSIGDGTATGKITDDDATTAQVSLAAPAAVAEGAAGATTKMTFTVGLSAASGRQVRVDYADAGSGTATADGDYSLTAGTLTFAPGDTSKTIDVTVNGDDVDEISETVVLRLSSPVNASFADGVAMLDATGTITDDDPTKVTLSAPSGPIAENGGSKILTVTLGRALTGDEALDVPLKLRGVATFGDDYTLAAPTTTPTGVAYSNLASDDLKKSPPTVSFNGIANAASSATLTLTAMADDIDEGASERVTVALGTLDANSGTNLDGGASGMGTVKFTITEDDGVPPTALTLTVDADTGTGNVQTSLAEGGGAKTVRVTATLGGSSTFTEAKTVTVEVGHADDGATEGTDYANVGRQEIEIAAGASSGHADFTLTPVDDAVDEESETISFKGTAAGLTVADATITLTDDDTKGVTVSEAGLTVRETDDGGTTETTENVATYTVVLASQPTGDVVIDVEVPEGAPFTASPSRLTFTASGAGIWSTAQEVTVTAVDDNVDNTGNQRSASITHALTVGSSDYDGVSVPDVTVTVTDDDAAPTALTLTVDADTETDNVQSSVSEGGGAKTVRVTATLGGSTTFAVDKTVTVEVGKSSDSATEGTDYAMVGTQSITLKAGASSAYVDFALTPTADSLHEGSETISLDGSLAGVTVTDAEITLTDDDDAPGGIALSVDTDSVTADSQTEVGEAAGATTVEVTATVTGSTTYSAAQTVAVSVSGDTATVTDDFAAVTGFTITIPAGTASARGMFTLTPVADAIDENDETVDVTGTVSGDGAPAVTGATITIKDDDTKGVTVSAASAGLTIRETDDGGTTETTENVATYTVVLTSQPTGNVVIDVEVPAGAPFTASPSRLTFTASGAGIWSTAQVVTVTAVDDNVDNTGNQRNASITHALTVGSSDYGGVSVPDVTVTVTDDDAAPTALTLTVDADTETDNVQTSLAEGGGAKTVRVTATLDGSTTFAVDKTVTVEVGKSSDSATEGTDYAMVGTQSITIRAGASSAHVDFALTPTDDAVDEENETISLDGSLAGVTVTDAEITLTDDDDAPGGIALSVDTDSVTADSQTEVGEAAGATTVEVTATVTGSTTYSAAQTVAVSVSGDTATVTDDFAAVTGFTITIPAGTASARGMFTLTPVADAIDENDETVDVTGTVSGDGAPAVTGATITIKDDDTKGVTVSAASAGLTIRETDDGGTTETTENVATYTVVLTSQPTGNVVIDVEVPAGAPFTASPSRLTFTASGAGIWSTAQVVTVTAVDDNVDNTGNARNASITHALTVGSSDYGGVSVPDVTVTVTDDDAAPTALTLTVDADTETDNVQNSLAEGGGAKTIRLTATLDGSTTFATDKTVTVEVGKSSDSATEGTDYAMVGTQSITIRAGASSAHVDFALTPTADSLHEGSETISLDGTLAGVTVTGAVITITDDDSAPTTATLTVDADTGTGNVQTSLAEGGGAKTVRVTATLGGSSTFTEAKTVTVEVGHADDGATEGTDYANVGRQEIEIAAGASSGHADFTLTPTDDAVDEESETISFKGTAAGLTVADATITLTDDDTKGVTVSEAGLTIRETDDGGTTETTENVATYTVVLTSQPTGNVVIDVEVPAGAPFTASPSRLTFTASGAGIWSTAQVVTVTAVDDNVDNTGNARNASITHALTVGSSDYGGVSVPDVTVTVTDDDAAPTALTLTVDADTETDNVQNSLAEGGGAKTVRVTATLDGSTTFATDKTVTVEVGKSSDSATEGTDYAMVGTQSITLKAGASSAYVDFALTPTADSLHEGSETISLDGSLAGVTVTDAEITLTDDDDAPGGIALSVDTDSVTADSQTEVGEAAGATTVEVTATVTGSTTYSGAQTVAVSVSGDTATVTDDFAAVTGFTITIPAGTASARGMFTLTPVADAIDENDETVDVTGTVSGDGAPAVTGATITIKDDDTKGVTVSAASTGLTIRETDDGGTTETTENVATYTVVLTSQPTGNVVIDVEVPAGAPFTASPSRLTFTASGAGIWSTAQVVTVTAVDDNVDNTGNARNASITHALTVGSSDYGGVSVPDVTVTVTDDDAAPTALTLTVDADTETDNVQNSLAEGGGAKTIRLTATLDGSTTFATDKTVTVEVGKSSDSATEGTDYAMVGTQSITIRAGASSAHVDFALTPTDDAVDEENETISLDGSLAGVTVTGAVITITDDDSAPTTATLTVDADTGTNNVQTSLAEGGGAKTIRLTATLDGSTTFTADKTVTVEVGDAGDSAAEGTDYAMVATQTITLKAGASSGHVDFTLTPVDDAVDEESETISFKGTAAGLTVADATITLTDDDTKGVTVSEAGLTIRETDDGSTAQDEEHKGTYTIVLDSQPTGAVVVNISVPERAPFTASPPSLTFTPGGAGIWSTAQEVTVTAVDDNVDNTGNQRSASITHALTVGSSDYDGVSVPDVTVTVTDDDAAPTALTLTVDADTETDNVQTSLAEGGGAKTVRVTATLDGSTTFAVDKTVTVEVGKSGDSATEGTDYAMVGTQSITLKAGASSAYVDFTLTPTDDAVDEENEIISLDGSLAGVTVTDAVITITDDDSAPTTATLTVDADTGTNNVQNSLAEDGGAKTVRVTATLGGSVTFTADKTVTVEVGNSGDGAAEGTDYAMVATQTITLKAGASSGHVDFTLTPVDDAVDEESETISFKGTAAGLTVADATITLTDDDTKGVTVSEAGLTIRETDDGSTAQDEEHKGTYTIVLDSQPTGAVVVNISVPEGAPFTASPPSLTFTPGGAGIWSTAQVVTVTAVDDNVDNTGNQRSASITHALTVGSSDYDGVSVPDVTVTVTDDDAAPTALTLTVDADTETDNVQSSVSEGGGAKTVRVTATLGGSTTFAVDKTVTVEVGKSSDSATEGTDYAMVGTQSITLKAGASSAYVDFALTPTADSLHEGSETISLDGTLAGVTVTDAVITLTDDDSAPTTATLTVDADTGTNNVQNSLAEGGGAKTIRLTATLDGSTTFTADKTVTVEVGDAGDSAAEGTDYAMVATQSIIIKAGASSGHVDFTLTPTQDQLAEGSETISFKGTATGLTVADATITITDDDAARMITVLLSASDYEVFEGEALTVKVNLSESRAADTVIALDPMTQTGQTATNGVDYDGSMRTVTILAGETSGTARISTTADDRKDPNETFTVAIQESGLSGDVILGEPHTAVVTIRERVTGVTPPATATVEYAGADSRITLTVPTDLQGNGIDVAFRYSTDKGTARSGGFQCGDDDDADLINREVVGSGTPGEVINRPTLRRMMDLDADTVDLEIELCPGSRGKTFDVIWDTTLYLGNPDRGFPGIRSTPFDAAAAHCSSASLCRTRVTIEGGDAVEACVSHSLRETVEFYAGEAHHGDAHVDRWKQVLAAFGDDNGYTPITAAEAQQNANQFQASRWNPVVTTLQCLEAAPAAEDSSVPAGPEVTILGGGDIAEGAAAVLTVQANPVPASDLTVALAIADDTASDFLAENDEGPKTVTIKAGESSAAYTLTTVDDNVEEADGSVSAMVEAGTGYRVGTPSKVVVAVSDDDDPAPVAPVVNIAGGAGVTEGAPASFTVTANPAPAAPLTVALTIDQSGDYAATGETGVREVVVPTEGSMTFEVATVNDTVDEPDGSISATLAAGTGYAVAASPDDMASVAVADDDVAAAGVPSFSVDDAEGKENEWMLRYTIRLSRVSDRTVSVWVHTRESDPVSARDGEDYVGMGWGTRIVFRPGTTEWELGITLINDSHDEGSETFEVELLAPQGGATIADGVGVMTIVNDDPMPAAWLARFGRTVAEQALDSIAGRIAAPREAGAQGTIAGQALNFGTGSGADGAANDAGSLSMAANDNARLGGVSRGVSLAQSDVARAFGASADRPGSGPGQAFGGGYGPDNTHGLGQSRTMTGLEALLGSSFTATGETDSSGGNLAFWGRAAQSSFDGREGAFSLDGETTTAMLGADYARSNWLVGLALMQSSGEGGYADAGTGSVRCPQDLDAETRAVLCNGAVREGDGDVEASLTAAVPYAAIQPSERLRLWGAAGYGTGEVTLKPEVGGALSSDISWTMAAAGARSDLLPPPREGNGLALALTTDVLWARTSSEKTHELAASDSDVTRLRLGLEGGYAIAMEGGGSLMPRVEIGARHDGGDAETGFGVELGGGIAWTGPAIGLSLDLSGRTLIAHGNDDLEVRGFAASLAFDPNPGTERGLSLTLTQDWGGWAQGGLDALFATDPLADRTGTAEATSRWQAEAAYGFPAFSGRFTGSPHVGLGLATGARDYTLGWRLSPAANANAPDVSFGMKATRRESDTAAPEHTVGFEAIARW